MKRKLLSLLLAAVMLLGVAAPALAAEAADQELMAVTAKVKDTLDLDTELYDDFQGDSYEDVLLGKRWNLNWTGDGLSLSITADNNGKIYSYRAYRAVDEVPMVTRSNGGRMDIPRLPEDKSKAAFETAKAFLAKVLDAGVETIDLSNEYRPSLQQDTYWYNGTILLNGLDSPISCHVSVRASDLTVLRFSRGDEDSGYLGDVPAADTKYTDAQALRSLTTTLDMEAKYVLQDDGKTARVQYVPLHGDDYYVDGVTGELVNLTELRSKLWSTGGGSNRFTGSMEDAAAPEAVENGSLKSTLTQAEKNGAAILKTALDKEELDKVLKNAWPELGLDKYTLATATYSISEIKLPEGTERTPDDYNVTCRLTYGRQLSDATANKYVTVDAKTGELQSLHSGRSYKDAWPETFPVSVSVGTAQSTAETFLRAFIGEDKYEQLGLFSTDNARTDKTWHHTFAFQQTANGYFYDGNAYTVEVDAQDGTISAVYGQFDEDVQLVTPAKVVDKAQAISAYAAALTLKYGYLEVPVSISLAGPQLMPLLKEAGYSYVNSLKTGFVLTQANDKYVSGVDAETGEAVVREYTPGEEITMTYDDIENHWVKTAAEALALFQVGFSGGSLKPADTLTQQDMIALLLSVEGYTFDPTTATKDDVDWLYQRAYTYGLVTPETRDEDKTVTRGELVKVLLNCAGYEKIAAIPGIFRCDFADAAAIPAADLGYAALAQGLGLINGGLSGVFAADRVATRAEAVSFLYQYMK